MVSGHSASNRYRDQRKTASGLATVPIEPCCHGGQALVVQVLRRPEAQIREPARQRQVAVADPGSTRSAPSARGWSCRRGRARRAVRVVAPTVPTPWKWRRAPMGRGETLTTTHSARCVPSRSQLDARFSGSMALMASRRPACRPAGSGLQSATSAAGMSQVPVGATGSTGPAPPARPARPACPDGISSSQHGHDICCQTPCSVVGAYCRWRFLQRHA